MPQRNVDAQRVQPEAATAAIACFAAFVGVTALGKRVDVSVSGSTRRENRLAIAVAGMAQRIGNAL